MDSEILRPGSYRNSSGAGKKPRVGWKNKLASLSSGKKITKKACARRRQQIKWEIPAYEDEQIDTHVAGQKHAGERGLLLQEVGF